MLCPGKEVNFYSGQYNIYYLTDPIPPEKILAPLSTDILFTVSLLVVSDMFPAHMQGLSGGVFNTCAQLGTAIGLTVTSVTSVSVTATGSTADGGAMEGDGCLVAGSAFADTGGEEEEGHKLVLLPPITDAG